MQMSGATDLLTDTTDTYGEVSGVYIWRGRRVDVTVVHVIIRIRTRTRTQRL